MQYLKWLGKVVRGDFGLSTAREAPVNELVKERLLLTVSLSFVTILFVWSLAIPIGVFVPRSSSTRFYDYIATFSAYIGVGTPNFLLALAIMWVVLDLGGGYIGGTVLPRIHKRSVELGPRLGRDEAHMGARDHPGD